MERRINKFNVGDYVVDKNYICSPFRITEVTEKGYNCDDDGFLPFNNEFRYTKFMDYPEQENKHEDVSLFVDKSGHKWIHVNVGKFDFLLDTVDFDDKYYTWNEAMQLAKDNGFKLNTKEEGGILIAYKDEIDSLIDSVDGKKMNDWYWFSSEYNGSSAWGYNATDGRLGNSYKMYSNRVRRSLDFNPNL